MSEENKIIEKEIENENKEVESNQESISDEAMSNIKDSSTWIDALLVIVYLAVISYSILGSWAIFGQGFVRLTSEFSHCMIH